MRGWVYAFYLFIISFLISFDVTQLQHAYLRVLHPLLTRTQLRSFSYKRTQIRNMLEPLVQDSEVRQMNPTTKRLVERCLTGEWLKKEMN